MFDWTTMEHRASEALDPESVFTPGQRARLQSVATMADEKPALGGLRRRIAGSLMRLAAVVDGGAVQTIPGPRRA